jgi:hypothetical protein
MLVLMFSAPCRLYWNSLRYFFSLISSGGETHKCFRTPARHAPAPFAAVPEKGGTSLWRNHRLSFASAIFRIAFFFKTTPPVAY